MLAQRRKSRTNDAIKDLKSDVDLLIRVFIVSMNREFDLDLFFQHENRAWPPSLSDKGALRISGQKSDILDVIQENVPEILNTIPTSCDGIIYDGAAFVHCHSPRNAKIFEEYWKLDLKPVIDWMSTSLRAYRVDFVWDTYSENSLKNTVRENMGQRTQRQVTATRNVERFFAKHQK